MSHNHTSSPVPTPPLTLTPDEGEVDGQVEEQEMKSLVEEYEEEAKAIQQEPEDEVMPEAAIEEVPPEEADIQQEDASFDAGAGNSNPVAQRQGYQGIGVPSTMAEWHRYQARHGVKARLFVGNLPTLLPKSEFQSVLRQFQAFGPAGGHMRTDNDSLLTTAFIQYENSQHAANALAAFEKNSERFDSRGRFLRVESARGGKTSQRANNFEEYNRNPRPPRYRYAAPLSPQNYSSQPTLQLPHPQHMQNFVPQTFVPANFTHPAFAVGGNGTYLGPLYNMVDPQGNGYMAYAPVNHNYAGGGNEGYFAHAHNMAGWQGNGHMPFATNPALGQNYQNGYHMMGQQGNGQIPHVTHPAADQNYQNGYHMMGQQGNGQIPHVTHPAADPNYQNVHCMMGHQGNGQIPFSTHPAANQNYQNVQHMGDYQGNEQMPDSTHPAPDPNHGNEGYNPPRDPNTEQQ